MLFTFGPLDTVAPAFSDTKFLGTDVDINAVKGKDGLVCNGSDHVYPVRGLLRHTQP